MVQNETREGSVMDRCVVDAPACPALHLPLLKSAPRCPIVLVCSKIKLRGCSCRAGLLPEFPFCFLQGRMQHGKWSMHDSWQAFLTSISAQLAETDINYDLHQ